MNKQETQRVTMNLPTDLLKRVEEYAEARQVNRTVAIILLLNKALP